MWGGGLGHFGRLFVVFKTAEPSHLGKWVMAHKERQLKTDSALLQVFYTETLRHFRSNFFLLSGFAFGDPGACLFLRIGNIKL